MTAAEEIAEILDGKEWTVEMLDEIAVILIREGYEIREPLECEVKS